MDYLFKAQLPYSLSSFDDRVQQRKRALDNGFREPVAFQGAGWSQNAANCSRFPRTKSRLRAGLKIMLLDEDYSRSKPTRIRIMTDYGI